MPGLIQKDMNEAKVATSKQRPERHKFISKSHNFILKQSIIYVELDKREHTFVHYRQPRASCRYT